MTCLSALVLRNSEDVHQLVPAEAKGQSNATKLDRGGPVTGVTQLGPVTTVTAAAAAPRYPKWHPNDPCIDPIRCQWVPRNAYTHPSAHATASASPVADLLETGS